MEEAARFSTDAECHERYVRHAIHAFNEDGRAALQEGSSRLHHLPTILRADIIPEMVNTVFHRPPRVPSRPASGPLTSIQCVHLGWMARAISIETMRQTLGRAGINWKRANPWITSPDLLYLQKKSSWPIGSGMVESANKVVVQTRLKGAGMYWQPRHVNPMLALRSVIKSERSSSRPRTAGAAAHATVE